MLFSANANKYEAPRCNAACMLLALSYLRCQFIGVRISFTYAQSKLSIAQHDTCVLLLQEPRFKPVTFLMYMHHLPLHPINHASRMDTGFFADYSFGSETYAITFIYVVRDGDSTKALDTWDAPANNELSVRGLTSWYSGKMQRESGAKERQSMQ